MLWGDVGMRSPDELEHSATSRLGNESETPIEPNDSPNSEPEGVPIDPQRYRHEKEPLYLTLSAIIAVFLWCGLFPTALIAPIVVVSDLLQERPINLLSGDWGGEYLIAGLIGLWAILKYPTLFYGNSVRVSEKQLGSIHQMVQAMAQRANFKHPPDVFIMGREGGLNALAARLLKLRVIILEGDLVDVLMKSKSEKELEFVIGHELAHHLLGHLSPAKLIFLLPVRVIPFIGAAYSRACELSADRLGAVLCGDFDAAKRALTAMACRSETLTRHLDSQAFMEQEQQLPRLRTWLLELTALHPRLTLRVRELAQFENRLRAERHQQGENNTGKG